MKILEKLQLNYLIEVTKEFKKGEYIVHLNNATKVGVGSLFKATVSDVENYSGKNGLYIVVRSKR